MNQLTPYQKAALDYNNHISLTANAGSGKTFVLSKRYVEIALNENIPLSKIVAITFTEKAAGELNKKIANEIETRIEDENDEAKQRILHRMRRQLTSANISTIHSFCINLLREFSPEAGLDANFSPMNQTETNEELGITVDDFIKEHISNTKLSEPLKEIIRLLGGKSNFGNEITKIVKNRKTLERLADYLYTKNDSEIIEHYSKYIKNYLNQLLENEVTALLKIVSELNKIVLELKPDNSFALETNYLIERFKNEGSVFDKLTTLSRIAEQILTSNFSVKKRGYLNKEYDNFPMLINPVEKGFNELKKILDLQINVEEFSTLLYYTKQISLLSLGILKQFENRKRKLGYLDFEDILIEAKKLTSNNEVVTQLYDKYDFIMIDEYQDTNEIQYEIFMPILNNLKKGNLFVVGDEKQSIYMFRDAELEIFSKTKNEIISSNLEGDLLLPHSFRVSPQIAHFVNELFKHLLDIPNPLYNEVEYKELICARDPSEKGNVEFLISDKDETEESDLVAAKILKEIENGNGLGDFSVLCRKRNSFFELEKSFNEFGIPYIIAGGKGFFQRQTVYDIYNYISFLLNPNDDASLVGILRSPFYLLPDNIILKISLETGKSFWDKFVTYSVDKKDYSEIVKQLYDHIELSSSIRISALLREILKSTQYWGIVAGKQNFEQEISNLVKLIGVGRGFALQSFKTLYDFKVYLDEAISLFEEEGQAQLTDYSNTVKIMTLHQAKGLEFKNVFLYKCNERVGDNAVKSKSLVLDKELGILTKVPVNKNYFSEYISPAILDIQNHIQKKKQVAEDKRLLYVGMTRAIDNLFITAKPKNEKFENNSFIDLIVQGLPINLFSEEYRLNSKLQFMKDAKEDFDIYEIDFATNIKITNEIEYDKNNFSSTPEIKPLTNFKVDEINDHEKNEIISATKIAIFTQCPTKYYLTYELGYIELLKITQTYAYNYDFKHGEDEETNIYADIKGQIIHKLLELETKPNELDSTLEKLIPKFIKDFQDVNFTEIKLKIINDLESYYNSEVYSELQTAEKYFNEFEVYSKEKDYYVYGIIDKLIIEDNTLTIIDYKTDRLDKVTIKEKAEHYIPQLKFYAYCIRKKFSTVPRVNVKLIFIQKPEYPVEFNFTEKTIEDFGNYISSSVEAIRKQNFPKNLKHCKQCHFFIDGQCAIQNELSN